MKTPQDRLPPRRAFADANGRAAPESLRDYFDFATFPDKATKSVKRHELAAILDRMGQVQEQMQWHRRLWRFLVRPLGSGPAKLALTKGEKDRGVAE